MKKLFDPEEYDKQVIQDHIRFLRAKKQVEDFKKQQMRTLDQLNNNISIDNKLLFSQDPKYLRHGFSSLFQNQAIPEQDKEYIVEQIVKRDQGDSHLMKRKRDQPDDSPIREADLSQMDIDEEDQQLYSEINVNNNEENHIDEFMPNKRRKLTNDTDANNNLPADISNTSGTHNNQTDNNEHIDTDANQKKRKAIEMDFENEIETKRRKID